MSGQVAWWKQGVVVLVLAAAAGGAWLEKDLVLARLGLAGAAEDHRRDRAEGVPVIVARVGMVRDDLALEAVGTGRAQRSVTLRSETSGKIVDIAVEAGRTYAEGETLLKLDDTDERLAVELSETRLQEALRARDRVAKLQDRGAAADVRFDEARTAAEIAALELDRARAALARRVVRAPFAGVAGISELDAGAWVDPGTAIASFDDRRVILVEFDLPEALLDRIRPGMAVSATTPGVTGARFEGSIAAIDTRVVAASRTVRVRVAIPNPDDRLRPGASFTVRLDLPGDVFPMVPELAVLFTRGSLLVWRIVDGRAEQIEVRMVRRRDGAILVDGPLADGDAVVVEGMQRLVPGKAVRVLHEPARGES